MRGFRKYSVCVNSVLYCSADLFEVLALQSPGMPRRGVSSPVVLTTMILLIMTFLPFCLAAGGGEGASAGPGTDFLTYLITKAVLLMW